MKQNGYRGVRPTSRRLRRPVWPACTRTSTSVDLLRAVGLELKWRDLQPMAEAKAGSKAEPKAEALGKRMVEPPRDTQRKLRSEHPAGNCVESVQMEASCTHLLSEAHPGTAGLRLRALSQNGYRGVRPTSRRLRRPGRTACTGTSVDTLRVASLEAKWLPGRPTD